MRCPRSQMLTNTSSILLGTLEKLQLLFVSLISVQLFIPLVEMLSEEIPNQYNYLKLIYNSNSERQGWAMIFNKTISKIKSNTDTRFLKSAKSTAFVIAYKSWAYNFFSQRGKESLSDQRWPMINQIINQNI